MFTGAAAELLSRCVRLGCGTHHLLLLTWLASTSARDTSLRQCRPSLILFNTSWLASNWNLDWSSSMSFNFSTLSALSILFQFCLAGMIVYSGLPFSTSSESLDWNLSFGLNLCFGF